jgi:hypothetical protein
MCFPTGGVEYCNTFNFWLCALKMQLKTTIVLDELYL